jgi:hypothetical protein
MVKQKIELGMMLAILVFGTLACRNGRLENEVARAQSLPSSGTDQPGINLQIQALEVTQGVRGEIPSRVAPNGALVLLPDGAVHVANRRTVVRAYPWVGGSPEAKIPPATARLWAYRDGELLAGLPITPDNEYLSDLSLNQELSAMRSDADKSWNFILTPEWTTSNTEDDSFELRFIVEINPPGPDHVLECQGCGADNRVVLLNQKFVVVPTLVIQPYFIDHTVTETNGNLVTYPGPTVDEFSRIVQITHTMLPVGDIDRGLKVLPFIEVEWQGLLYENEKHVFAEAMIERYLPGGELNDREDGIIHVFVFNATMRYWYIVNQNSGGMRLGLAWTGKPYAQCGARADDLVHELTHAIGLSHAGIEHGETTSNLDYPDPSGRVEPNAYGFDIWEMRAVPPVSEDSETHDYMSYDKENPLWVSIYTWKVIGGLLGQPDLDV